MPVSLVFLTRGNRHIRKNISNIFVDFFEKMRIIGTCMDRKNDCKIPDCGNLPGSAGGKLVVGSKQLRKAVCAGRARCVFLAENADPGLTGPLEALCQAQNVQITWVRSMADLGRACGIEVGAAAAAVVET